VGRGHIAGSNPSANLAMAPPPANAPHLHRLIRAPLHYLQALTDQQRTKFAYDPLDVLCIVRGCVPLVPYTSRPACVVFRAQCCLVCEHSGGRLETCVSRAGPVSR
jgi:hypothetical protein